MRKIWWHAHICAGELKAASGSWLWAVKHLLDRISSICSITTKGLSAWLRDKNKKINLIQRLMEKHKECVCVCVHIDQRSGSLQEPPADLRPQWMRSYCGFEAPEQLGEFMVSTRKRRALSSCQGRFPSLSQGRPLWSAKDGHTPQPCIWGEESHSTDFILIYCCYIFVAKQFGP